MTSPFDPDIAVNVPVALFGGATFIFAGWYHFRRAQDLCRQMAECAARVPFLAHYYRSRSCYLTLRAGGLLALGIGMFVFSVGLWHCFV